MKTIDEARMFLYGIIAGAIFSFAGSITVGLAMPYLTVIYKTAPLIHVGIFAIFAVIFVLALYKIYKFVQSLDDEK